QQFSALDVYLSTKILADLSSDYYTVPVNIYLEMLDNLLEIDEDILKQSQVKARSTDLLLYSAEYEFTNIEKSFDFSTTNYIVKGLNTSYSNTTGVVLFKDSTKLDTIALG